MTLVKGFLFLLRLQLRKLCRLLYVARVILFFFFLAAGWRVRSLVYSLFQDMSIIIIFLFCGCKNIFALVCKQVDYVPVSEGASPFPDVIRRSESFIGEVEEQESESVWGSQLSKKKNLALENDQLHFLLLLMQTVVYSVNVRITVSNIKIITTLNLEQKRAMLLMLVLTRPAGRPTFQALRHLLNLL